MMAKPIKTLEMHYPMIRHGAGEGVGEGVGGGGSPPTFVKKKSTIHLQK